MTKISCYKTQADDLTKTFCKIAEKCYYSKQKALVITQNEDYLNSLDKSLWTYSKQHFIPHATMHDSRHHDQSVLITTNLENSNNSEIIILINPVRSSLLKLLSKDIKLLNNNIQKIIFIIDEYSEIQMNDINNTINKSCIKDSETTFFNKDSKGNWLKTTLNTNK